MNHAMRLLMAAALDFAKKHAAYRKACRVEEERIGVDGFFRAHHTDLSVEWQRAVRESNDARYALCSAAEYYAEDNPRTVAVNGEGEVVGIIDPSAVSP